MCGKLLDRSRKLVDDRLDDMIEAQRRAVDRIVQRYRRSGAARGSLAGLLDANAVCDGRSFGPSEVTTDQCRGRNRRSKARGCDDLSVDEDRDGPPHMLRCRLTHLLCTGRGELHADPELGRAISRHDTALRDIAVRDHDLGVEVRDPIGAVDLRRDQPFARTIFCKPYLEPHLRLDDHAPLPESRASKTPDDGQQRGGHEQGDRSASPEQSWRVGGASREHGLLHSKAVPVGQRGFVAERIGVSQKITRGSHRFLRNQVRGRGQGRGDPWPDATEQ